MDEIYRLYASSVFRYLVSITSNPELAEELTQETFYQAIRSIHRFKGQCKMFVWLCQIAKHLYFDHLKRQKPVNRFIRWDQLEQEPTSYIFDLPEDAFRVKSDVAALYRAIRCLPDAQRETVLLRVIGDLSFRQIGELMGHTENWARVTFYRARVKLKGMVNEHE